MRSDFFKRSKIDVSRWTSQNYSKDLSVNEKQTYRRLSAGKYEKAIANEDWFFFQWTNHSQANAKYLQLFSAGKRVRASYLWLAEMFTWAFTQPRLSSAVVPT